jgi:hypothetical protein
VRGPPQPSLERRQRDEGQRRRSGDASGHGGVQALPPPPPPPRVCCAARAIKFKSPRAPQAPSRTQGGPPCTAAPPGSLVVDVESGT